MNLEYKVAWNDRTFAYCLNDKVAWNQSFVQNEIGSKIELYEYSPTLEILLFLAIAPISAYYSNNKLYYFLIKSP